MADPEDLKAYQGASRDAYCRLSAGEERFLASDGTGSEAAENLCAHRRRLAVRDHQAVPDTFVE